MRVDTITSFTVRRIIHRHALYSVAPSNLGSINLIGCNLRVAVRRVAAISVCRNYVARKTLNDDLFKWGSARLCNLTLNAIWFETLNVTASLRLSTLIKASTFEPICKMIFVILIQAQTSNQRVYPIYPSLDKSSPTQNEFPYVCFDPHLRPTCIDRLSLGRSLLFSHLMQDSWVETTTQEGPSIVDLKGYEFINTRWKHLTMLRFFSCGTT